MGLLSIFKRTDRPSTAANGPADAVQQARTRARQRLIGAAVLVVIGIIGFPLVFETQPRPIPVDIPIEVPRKEGAPALVMPAARPTATNSSASAVTAAPVADASADVITESREDAGKQLAVPVAPPPAAASKPEVKPPSKPPAAAAAVEPKPDARPEAAPAGDGARARALLEGKPSAATSAAGTARFVVQVGAFADASAARETRLKVEKLGLKTYTQVASTASGNRIRVRVGPFGTRDEADRAMAKAKGAGLSAVVLTL
jgi:DedD protein